jgi:hypothetical protein
VPAGSFGVTVSFSDVQGIAPGGAPPNVNNGGGNIGAAPVFFDQSAGNYRLARGSPCIDAANNVRMPPDEFDVDDDNDMTEPNPDRDLNARVFDDPIVPNTGMPDLDMGAYEFCPYDLNGDGDVAINDLLILLGAWGPNPGHPADFDGDGMVDIDDLLDLLANWGGCNPSEPVSVPQSVEDCIERFGYEDPLVLEHCICAVEPEECP